MVNMSFLNGFLCPMYDWKGFDQLKSMLETVVWPTFSTFMTSKQILISSFFLIVIYILLVAASKCMIDIYHCDIRVCYSAVVGKPNK